MTAPAPRTDGGRAAAADGSAGGGYAPARGARFTLMEMLVVAAVLAIVLGLVAPRVGRVPSRVQAEYCVSAVRTALDVAALRARTTGQACRLVLVPEGEAGGDGARGGVWWGGSLQRWGLVNRRGEDAAEGLGPCVFVMEPAEPDPVAQMLSGRGAAAGLARPPREEPERDLFGLARDRFPLPGAVAWDGDSFREATSGGARGPAFVFQPSGEAAGPALEFAVGKRRFRLEVDSLTGRVDIRPVTNG